MVKSRRRVRRSSASRPVRSGLSALCWGVFAGYFILAIYALLVAQLWPHGQYTAYFGFALVLVAVPLTAGIVTRTLRQAGIARRFVVMPTVWIATFAVLVPASLLRLLPPEEVGGWLASWFDMTISLPAQFAALDVARAPILSDKLMASEASIALMVELVLIAVVVYALTALGLRRGYCVACGSPCELRSGVARRVAGDLDAARKHLKRRDWAFFRDRGDPEATGSELRFDVLTCPTCGGTSSLDVIVECTGKRDTPLVRDLVLNRDDVRTVTNLAL